MSQLPPNVPYDNTLPYSSPAARNHPLALTAMILGIVSIPLVCAFGGGIILGLTAIILGVIARSGINKNPALYGGRGMATTGIATGSLGFLILPLLIAV